MPHALAADLDALTGRRIFFGHQSVGENILAGLTTTLAAAGRAWPIVDLAAGPPPPAPSPDAPLLLHARVGTNQQPLTKLAEFRRRIDEDLPGAVDVALLKLCYIDIDERTDTTDLADRYLDTLRDLAARHPRVAFVAVTTPLRHSPGGLGVWVRERLGRPNHSKRANLARGRFNDRLRQAWPAARLFDLAAVEATDSQGRRQTFRYDGATGETLVGAYTSDGGHLNEAGQAHAAEAFVRALAQATRSA